MPTREELAAELRRRKFGRKKKKAKPKPKPKKKENDSGFFSAIKEAFTSRQLPKQTSRVRPAGGAFIESARLAAELRRKRERKKK